MGEKKNPPVHEGLRECLVSPMASKAEIALVAHLYGKLNSKCPADAIPSMVEAFETRLDTPDLESDISLAISNLRLQLNEHEAAEKKKHPPETCPDCSGKLEEVMQPEDSPLNYDQWAAVRRGDLRCTGDCRKFFFFVDGELKPGHNE